MCQQAYEQQLAKVADVFDVETFIIADSKEDAQATMTGILKQWGFKDIDFVFLEKHGLGVRVRARGYVHRPGDHYGWLQTR